MIVEDFYKQKGYPKLDKFDKKVAKFTYYDLIEFADDYYKFKTWK